MEPMSATLLTFGAILMLASWIQLLFNSFEDDYTWGLTTLFVPFLSYFYGLWAWEKSKSALKMGFIGMTLVAFGLL